MVESAMENRGVDSLIDNWCTIHARWFQAGLLNPAMLPPTNPIFFKKIWVGHRTH